MILTGPTTAGSVFCGTYNLNGRPPGTESLLPWLFPDPCALHLSSFVSLTSTHLSSAVEPDILVIGFQEIVQLTPGQIVSGPLTNLTGLSSRYVQVATDPEKK